MFFEDFSDTFWIENMFKPIRAINRTDSEVIWTRICEDIDHLKKRPSPVSLKKIPNFTVNLSISSPATDTVKKYSKLFVLVERK